MILDSLIGIASTGFGCGLLAGCGVALLLQRRRASSHPTQQYNTRFMYSGNLKQTNLLDAIQFLELGRREGILHVYVGRRKGYITFVNGEVVDAFYRNTLGKEGIFQMLELDYGDFYFESKVINQPRVISETIMDLALEWDARKYGDAYGGEEVVPEAPGGEQPNEAYNSQAMYHEGHPMGGYPTEVGMDTQNPYLIQQPNNDPEHQKHNGNAST